MSLTKKTIKLHNHAKKQIKESVEINASNFRIVSGQCIVHVGGKEVKELSRQSPQKTATELLHMKFPQCLCRVNTENGFLA